jgi:cytochrome c peroxidase
MHAGNFFDPRLHNKEQYPVAARANLGNVRASASDDRITPKLAALHFYQLAIPVPKPPDGSFDRASADRGRAIFNGKSKCAVCHVPPIFTEPGWNLHKPEEIGIGAFQAEVNHYNTFMKLGLTTAETRDLIEYLKSL